jgi:hypothetical protein
MIDLTLVPFGLQEATGELVDVHSVGRGAACGCICPSCRTPLIARQGKAKIWHFAHESRGTEQHAQEPCDYSLWVSIKLMARQLFKQASSVTVPAHKIYGHAGRHSIELEVTREQSVQVTNVETETVLCGMAVDVAAQIPSVDAQASFRLGFCFEYPGRAPNPIADTSELAAAKAGLIEIDLSHVARLFAGAPRNSGSAGYRELLRAFLFDTATAKRWLFHPRQSRKMAELRKTLKQLRETAGPEPLVSVAPPPRSAPAQRGEILWYGCRACRVKWVGLTSPRTFCLKCNEAHDVVTIGPGAAADLGTGASRWDECQ